MQESPTNGIPLSQLPLGKKARVLSLSADGLPRRRLLDLGIVPRTIIEAIRVSPSGDPRAYRVRGTTIGLREEDAREILVQPIDE